MPGTLDGTVIGVSIVIVELGGCDISSTFTAGIANLIAPAWSSGVGCNRSFRHVVGPCSKNPLTKSFATKPPKQFH